MAGWEPFEQPKAGRVFKHYKSDLYDILETGFIEATEEPCITYRSQNKGFVGVRTARDFFATIKHDSKTLPRFRPID